jgi:hypothetical protein
MLGNPDSTSGDLRGMAADIRAAGDHAEHLIGALLILARNERGLTVHEEIDLATVAEDVLDTADPGDRQAHATLESAVISGDPVLAEHLVANLVDNATSYNVASGDIWISTRTAVGSSELTVANTGPVISPADADRIFQPFQRLNDRTSHDGSGLGLTIVASSPRSTAAPPRPASATTAASPSRSPSPRPAPRSRAPAHRQTTTSCSTPRLTSSSAGSVRCLARASGFNRCSCRPGRRRRRGRRAGRGWPWPCRSAW